MPYVNKQRPYAKEYQQQKARGEHADRMERQRARRAVDKTGADRNKNGKADRREGKDIALWEDIRLEFRLSGNIEPAKGYRAVALSIDKYCSVAETLRRAGARISWEVYVNDVKVENA